MFDKKYPAATRINVANDTDVSLMTSVCSRAIERSVVHIPNDNFFNITPAGKYRVILDIGFEEDYKKGEVSLSFTRSLQVPVTTEAKLTRSRDAAWQKMDAGRTGQSVTASFYKLYDDLRTARDTFPRVIHMRHELTVMKLFIYDALLDNNNWAQTPDDCIGNGIRLVHIRVPTNSSIRPNKWKIYSMAEMDMEIIHQKQLTKRIEKCQARMRG